MKKRISEHRIKGRIEAVQLAQTTSVKRIAIGKTIVIEMDQRIVELEKFLAARVSEIHRLKKHASKARVRTYLRDLDAANRLV